MKRLFAFALCLLWVLCLVPAAGVTDSGDAGTAVCINESCTISVPERLNEYAWRLTDGWAGSFLAFEAGEELTVSSKEPIGGYMLFGSGTMFTAPCLWVELAGEKSFSVELIDTAEIFEVKIYSVGEVPSEVQRWKSPDSSADVLVVAAYPGDELSCFSGLIPSLINEGASVQVVWASTYSRERMSEGLSALWSAGVELCPLNLGIETNRSLEEKYLKGSFALNSSTARLSELIKSLKPRIIVTHGTEGDRDMAATVLTARMVDEAAAMSDYQGRVFHRQAGTAALTLGFDSPLWQYEGKTAKEVTAEAFKHHYLQGVYHYELDSSLSFLPAGGQPIGATLLDGTGFIAAATPSPTPTPTPTPSPTPTPEVTPIPLDEQLTEEPLDEGFTFKPWYTLILGAVAAVILLTILLIRRTRPAVAAAFALIPLMLAVVAMFLLAALMPKSTEPTVSVMTASPTPTPTEEPTPTPTAEPSATPMSTPAPIAESFSVDTEKGEWYYQNENLKIEIKRTVTDAPLVYFVAHIYMDEVDAFRPGFGNEGRTGRTSEAPWKIARRNKAVLLITGDNILNMDTEYKGILMRDGKVFQNRTAESILVMRPEEMGISVYEPKELSLTEAIQNGYENIFSFGPILMRDGVRNERMKYSRLAGNNPRCGVGLVEKGHLVVIVVDGRRPKYSIGMTLEDFTDLFVKEGCTTVYNLDGGVSAAMVFMGEQLNSHGNKENYSQQRNLPDALLWGYSEQVPSLSDPIYNDGIDLNG